MRSTTICTLTQNGSLRLTSRTGRFTTRLVAAARPEVSEAEAYRQSAEGSDIHVDHRKQRSHPEHQLPASKLLQSYAFMSAEAALASSCKRAKVPGRVFSTMASNLPNPKISPHARRCVECGAPIGARDDGTGGENTRPACSSGNLPTIVYTPCTMYYGSIIYGFCFCTPVY